MKPQFFRKRDVLWCILPVVVYAILFPIVAHTRMIEKVMALSFSWWELLLIAAFLVSRLLTYLMVPSLIAALLVYIIVKQILGQYQALPNHNP